MQWGVVLAVHEAQHAGGEREVEPVPLRHKRRLVAPVAAHLPERLPHGRGGEEAGACEGPQLKEHAQYALTQLVTKGICGQRQTRVHTVDWTR